MNNKSRILIIGSLAIVFISSLLFFYRSENAYVGYGFASVGIILGVLSVLFLTGKNLRIPQDLAFPIETKIYLTGNILLSFLVLVLEITQVLVLPFVFLIIVQTGMMVIYVFKMIAIDAGKEHIDLVEDKVKSNVLDLNKLLLQVDAIKAGTLDLPEGMVKRAMTDIQAVHDAIRYGDPMVPSEMKPVFDGIGQKLTLLREAVSKEDAEAISSLCMTIQRKVSELNYQTKIMK